MVVLNMPASLIATHGLMAKNSSAYFYSSSTKLSSISIFPIFFPSLSFPYFSGPNFFFFLYTKAAFENKFSFTSSSPSPPTFSSSSSYFYYYSFFAPESYTPKSVSHIQTALSAPPTDIAYTSSNVNRTFVTRLE